MVVIMARKLRQAGYSNTMRTELKFERKTNKYDSDNMQHIHILSRHHKRIADWNDEYRNKYSCDRWINDARGCGYGCLVSKKRFTY